MLSLKPEDEKRLHPEALKWFNAQRAEIQFEVPLEELSDDDLNTFLLDDEKPTNSLEALATGHLWRQTPSRITVFHNADYPSHLLLPVTKGNIIETYISGGRLPQELFPYRTF